MSVRLLGNFDSVKATDICDFGSAEFGVGTKSTRAQCGPAGAPAASSIE